MRRILAICSLFTLTGCAELGPHIGPVLARVDVARLIECRSAGDFSAVARCLGAEAASQGLRVAYEEAVQALDRALEQGNPHAGAADLEDRHAAAELDAALDHLALEIYATQAGAS